MVHITNLGGVNRHPEENMMQSRAGLFLVTVVGTLAIAAAIALTAHAQEAAPRAPGVETPGIQQEILINAPLAQFPGKRILVFTGEFEPGAKTPFHRHPGTELLYVLEGTGIMVLPGRESENLTPGTMVLVEPDAGESSFTHQAINLSETNGLRTLVIVIHDEGTPPALPVTDKDE